jgi:hypothetical protein
MRKAVYHLLTTDATLSGLLPAEKWYERGAVKDSPTTPFAVLAWQGTSPNGRGRTGVPRLTLWVYEHRGSYVLIDQVLARAREVLEGAAQYSYEGQRIAQVDFDGSSVDLYDDIYKCNTRNSGFVVIGSGL